MHHRSGAALKGVIFVVIAFLASCVDAQRTEAPPDAARADLYVAPEAVTGADGSFQRPYASLRQVAREARPGDLVLLRGGVYDEVDLHVYFKVRISGTEEEPITIRSYPGERAIFDGSQHPWYPREADDGHDLTRPLLVNVEGDHVVWEDITFRNAIGRSFYVEGDHNVLRRIESYANHSDGVHLRGNDNLLEYIHSHHNFSVANDGDSADGIKIEGHDDGPSSGNVVRFAHLHDNSDDGIDIWDSIDTIIEYSVAHDNGRGETGNGTGYKLGCDGCTADNGTVARNDVAYRNRYHNFTTNYSAGVTFYNNTSWDAGGVGFFLYSRVDDGEPATNVARNNLSYDDDDGSHMGTTGVDDEFNSWNLEIDDPRFLSLDPDQADFLRLPETSTAREAGTDVGLPFDGEAPDLGALTGDSRVRDLFR